jgi:hypothetical protein
MTNLYFRILPPTKLKENGSLWRAVQVAYDKVKLTKYRLDKKQGYETFELTLEQYNQFRYNYGFSEMMK